MRAHGAIYECPDALHLVSMKAAGDDIYANVPPPVRRRQQDTPDTQKHGHLKVAALWLAGLCFLLLIVIIGVSIWSAADKAAQQNKICNLERTIKMHRVNLTLDPDTAHPLLILSPDLKQVWHGKTEQEYPENPKRFVAKSIVLASQSFLGGRYYYEVGVGGKVSWTLGVVRESFKRNVSFTLPADGLWGVWMRYNRGNSIYRADHKYLDVKQDPVRVGVFVDYNASSVAFYNADTWGEMYTYKDADFREKLYPYFNPEGHNEGQNVSPLIIQIPIIC